MPGCHTTCPLCYKDMEDCQCLEESEVQGRYFFDEPENDGVYSEETLGSINLRVFDDKIAMPRELEIEGYTYIREDCCVNARTR